jgi:hypothetical protein
MVDGQGPAEIGKEVQGTPQDSEKDRDLSLMVPVDLRSDLSDRGLNLFLLD